MRKRRWVFVGSIVLALLLAALFAIHAATAGQYAFLSQFSGELRSNMFTISRAADTRDRYSFTRNPYSVKTAMKRDLTANGWTLLYEDEEYAAFGQPGAPGGPIAEFSLENTDYMPGRGPRANPPTTCVVVMPHHEPNWVEAAISTLKARFGKVEKPRTIAVLLRGHDIKVDTKGSMAGDRVRIELTLKNRTPDAVTANLRDFYLRGYESDETDPMVVTIAPWKSATSSRTFPPESLKVTEGRLGYRATYSGKSLNSDGKTDFFGCEPRLGLTGHQTGVRDLVITNDSKTRPGELRDLEIKPYGTPAVKYPGVMKFEGDKRVAIPFKYTPSRRFFVVAVSGWWRLSPNKRWVHFNSEP